MEIASWIIIIALTIGAIASLISGIMFLIKYSSTKKSKNLFLGIILTFIVTAILLYSAFSMFMAQNFVIRG